LGSHCSRFAVCRRLSGRCETSMCVNAAARDSGRNEKCNRSSRQSNSDILKEMCSHLIFPFARPDQYLAVVLGCLQQFRFLGTSIFSEALFRLSMGITHWSGEIFPTKERPPLMICPKACRTMVSRIANGVSATILWSQATSMREIVEKAVELSSYATLRLGFLP
jgi:hypothetical protein